MTTTTQVTAQKLREISLLQEASAEALTELAAHAFVRDLHAGETLFEQDAPGDAFYLIEEGQMHIVRHYASGEEVVLATLGPYDVVGELSGVVGQPRTGSVVAASDCTLIGLEHRALMHAVEHIPGVASSVMRQLGLRLYRMNLQVREHAIGNAQARVASLLLLLAGDKPGLITPTARIIRMARATGMDPDMLERLLREWARLGYLEFDGRRLGLRSVEAIRGIAG
jgi:CRP-like cAMP-binding protein